MVLEWSMSSTGRNTPRLRARLEREPLHANSLLVMDARLYASMTVSVRGVRSWYKPLTITSNQRRNPDGTPHHRHSRGMARRGASF